MNNNTWVIRHKRHKLLLCDYEGDADEDVFVATYFTIDPLKFDSAEAALSFLQSTKLVESNNEVVLYEKT